MMPCDRIALGCQGSYDRRCIMALAVQQIHPVAHVPLVLGILRRPEVAALIDHLIPPHPAHVLSAGCGVEALVLAILDGDHALYKALNQHLCYQGQSSAVTVREGNHDK